MRMPSDHSLIKFLVIYFCIFFTAPLNGSVSYALETTSPRKIGASGHAIPRFVSIADTKANMRTGPNLDYPIKWIYQRQGLPLKVIDEYGPWRKVQDYDGTIGWIHVQILSGKRTVLIIGHTRRLYKKPTTTSPVKIIAEKGVIGQLLKCDGHWCFVEIEGTKGWIESQYIYGLDRDL